MALILGHRGANKRAPQNTIPAFKAAIEHGADGVEFDVQMSSDGVLVICHNFTINETSNGSGNVCDLTFEELRVFDFGAWFAPEFVGTKIPTLKETLDTVKDMKCINVEIKKPPVKKREVVEKTVAMVKEYGIEDKVIFSSFDFEVTDMIKEIDPSLKVGLLYDPLPEDLYDKRLVLGEYVKVAQEHNADALHPHVKLTGSIYNRKCHKNDIAVNIWGVKNDMELEKAKLLDYDIIITDAI